MSDPKLIYGFTVIIDKAPPKWSGTVYLKSNYKELGEYVTSTKDSFSEAIQEIVDRYSHHVIEGLKLSKSSE